MIRERAADMHGVLNTVTELIDPVYETSVVACDSAEAVIIGRMGSTEDRDRADMQKIRSSCNLVYASFEQVRESQLVARDAADKARRSGRKKDLNEALKRVKELRQAASEARSVWSKQRKRITEVIRG